MSEELVTPEMLSAEMLKEMFSSAYMEASIDQDGDVYVKEEIGCYCQIPKSKARLKLLSIFRAQPQAGQVAKLEFCNRVNDGFIVARASVRANGDFCFEYYIPVLGGITKRCIVQATKFFLALVPDVIRECDTEKVVA